MVVKASSHYVALLLSDNELKKKLSVQRFAGISVILECYTPTLVIGDLVMQILE